jgi:hypothetical protein
MQQMGWGDFELNYFTYRLALECLEAYGLNKSEYKAAQSLCANINETPIP